MPEVKELKRLTVAGSATEKQEKEFFVQWHLTERCNLACRHCYQKGERPGEMDLSGVREVAGEVSDMVEKLGGDVRHFIFAQLQCHGRRAPPAARYL